MRTLPPRNLALEPSRGLGMMIRRLLVIGSALTLAVTIIRNAAVAALAPLDPAAAAWFWSGHPAVEISMGLAEIGRAARERRPIDQHVFAMINDAAVKSPLAPEPFLVRGVQAQTAGDGEGALRAFQAAQWREPRSLPAAYFLANYYFRSGERIRGLEQIALLARLAPSGADVVAPFLAAYARNPKSWPEVRAVLRSQPGLEDRVLLALAQNPSNANAILALADPANRRSDSAWLQPLLDGLVRAGDYLRARSTWSSVARVNGDHSLLFDADFSDAGPPPPFNWRLGSSAVGLAERQPGKRLHVMFYGNEDGVLASQLLLLPAGIYHLSMDLAGSTVHPELLRWSLVCDKSTDPFASAPVTDIAAHGWTFAVPANCPAQWLDLTGRSGDVAQQSDITMTGLSLVRAGANA